MQHFKGLFEKWGFILQVQPKEAMPFQGKGSWRQYVLPDLGITVREKFPVGFSINGIGKFFPPKKEGKNGTYHVA